MTDDQVWLAFWIVQAACGVALVVTACLPDSVFERWIAWRRRAAWRRVERRARRLREIDGPAR